MEAQRIAIVGAGAVGSYYGARLAQAGHDVGFLLRRDYEAVRRDGLRIDSVDGDFTIEQPSVAQSAAEIGPVDWVICALKATAIDLARDLLAACVGGETRILVLMNGLGLEDRFAAWFGARRVFGGMAFTCIHRGAPSVIHHLRYGPITIGHYGDDPAEIGHAVGLWDGARVEVSGVDSLLRGRWEKLAWNIPFNGLAVVAGGLPTDRIVGDPELRAAARATMEEVVLAGDADLAAHGQESRIDGRSLIRTMFERTDAMGPYLPSSVIDFRAGRPLEVDAIFGEPLRRARALGVPTPHIALLTALLRAVSPAGAGGSAPRS